MTQHKKRQMGHTIFVPLDQSSQVTINSNFFTQICLHCGEQFHSWKPAKYCCPSHKASNGRKRMTQRHKEQVNELLARIEFLESQNE
jgi:hypothetical protein